MKIKSILPYFGGKRKLAPYKEVLLVKNQKQRGLFNNDYSISG